MLDLAPDKETAIKMLCAPTKIGENPKATVLETIRERYFYHFASEIKKHGLLEDVILKKNHSTPLISTLSESKQKRLLDLAEPETLKKVYADKSLIFSSQSTLNSILNSAPDIDTKLRILRTTNENGDCLLCFPNLAVVCFDCFEDFDNILTNTKDEHLRLEIKQKVDAVKKEMMLHINSNGKIAIGNTHNSYIASKLLYHSPDRETNDKQLSAINFDKYGLCIDDDMFGLGYMFEKTCRRLNMVMDSPIHNKYEGITVPAAAYLKPYQLEYVLKRLNNLNKYNLLMKTVTIKYDSGEEENKPLSACLREYRGGYDGYFDEMRDGKIWKQMLRIASSDDIGAKEALELFTQYDFVVPYEEQGYYRQIIQSLKEQIAQNQ